MEWMRDVVLIRTNTAVNMMQSAQSMNMKNACRRSVQRAWVDRSARVASAITATRSPCRRVRFGRFNASRRVMTDVTSTRMAIAETPIGRLMLLLLDRPSDAPEVLPKRIRRVLPSGFEIIREAQLRPQGRPGANRVRLGPFPGPDLLGDREDPGSLRQGREDHAVVVGDDELGGIHPKATKGSGRQGVRRS